MIVSAAEFTSLASGCRTTIVLEAMALNTAAMAGLSGSMSLELKGRVSVSVGSSSSRNIPFFVF